MRLMSRVLGAESVTLFCRCVGDGGAENSGRTGINGVLLGAELWGGGGELGSVLCLQDLLV